MKHFAIGLMIGGVVLSACATQQQPPPLNLAAEAPIAAEEGSGANHRSAVAGEAAGRSAVGDQGASGG